MTGFVAFRAGANVWVMGCGFMSIVVWAEFPLSEQEAIRACSLREIEGIRLFPQQSEAKAHELAALLAK